MTDTIAQISTAPAMGAVAVIRISGGDSLTVLKKIFVRRSKETEIPFCKPQSRRMYYGYVKDKGRTIDEVLVCYMRAPYTYTKEDVAEIYCHGGWRMAKKILGLITDSGARIAEPGEFTKRAFLNGRIDLSQAEAVAGLISARTDAAAAVSLSQLNGGLKDKISYFRDRLLSLAARIEAALDFPEDDIETADGELTKKECADIIGGIEDMLKTADYGKIIKDGIDIAIAGRPNAGKSTLFNAILNEERAIVTEKPGTTRDTLTEQVMLGGVLYNLTDTAGIRETDDETEGIGVSRARGSIKNADISLCVIDGSADLCSEDSALLEFLADKKKIIVINKTDLGIKADISAVKRFAGDPGANPVFISAAEHTGLDELYARINEIYADAGVDRTDETVIIANERHAECLRRAVLAVRRAVCTLAAGMGADLITVDLTDAYNALGEITGETPDGDVIDRIFRDFCVGK